MNQDSRLAEKNNEVRGVLLLLACGSFVSGVTIRVGETLLPKMSQEFSVSVGEAAIIITAFTFAYGFFQLIHGPLGDRFGKVRMICLMLGASALGCLGCAMSHSLHELAAYRFATGMTAGAIIPLSFAFLGDNVAIEERQHVLARFVSGTMLGQAAGPLIGGLFSDFLGWRAIFLVLGAALALMSLVLAKNAWSRAEPQGQTLTGVKDLLSRYVYLLRKPRVRLVVLVAGIEGFLFFGAFSYIGAYLIFEFDLSYTVVGMVIAGNAAGGIAYGFFVRHLIKRLGLRGLVTGGGIVMLLCYLGLSIAPVWWLCVPFVIMSGFGFYMLHNTLQTQATEMAPEARGSAVSSFAFSMFLSQALGVWLAGCIVGRFGYAPIFVASGIGLLALARWFARRVEMKRVAAQ
ncbi:MAG: MFS transporter [Betaproteobacteria bacterium]|nr:MFS transporter [Betaproteobacteria bacterium]